MSDVTPYLQLVKPEDGDESWGDEYRSTMDKIDAFAAATASMAGSAAVATRFEWQVVNEESVPLFMGTAPQGTAEDDTGWIIKRFDWTVSPTGEAIVTSIDVATGAWSDRATFF